MRKKAVVFIGILLWTAILCGCGSKDGAGEQTAGTEELVETSADAMSEGSSTVGQSVEAEMEPAKIPSEAVSEENNTAGQPAEAEAEPAETAELPDGIYAAEFKTDSSMFHVSEACDGKGILTVEKGKMTIHISLGSKKIVNLYPGLAKEAAKEGAELLEPTEDTVTYSDGMTEEVYGFDVPVPVLDKEFDLALIGTKGVWYDHKVSVSNPEPLGEEGASASAGQTGQEDSAVDSTGKTVQKDSEAALAGKIQKATLADGVYTAEITFEGGSGKAEILSPVTVNVAGEEITAVVQWSSPNYDYMLVEGEKYLPINTEGNSVFEIPVACFDVPVKVIGDTVAMSKPHEVEYTITFHSDTVQEAGKNGAESTAARAKPSSKANPEAEQNSKEKAEQSSKSKSKQGSSTKNKPSSKAQTDISPNLSYTGSMELQYAENFTVDYYEGGYKLLTTNIDGKQFLVTPEKKEIPKGLEKGIVTLQSPIEDIYLVASAVMDIFSRLDGLDAIGFSGQKEEGWYIEEARDAMAKGDILYAGKYNRPDYELIVAKNCSLAIENRMISHSPEVMEKLESFGIPVMIEYSSSEPHPLGRVEWVKFFGALLGKEAEAERIFKEQSEILEKVAAEEKTDKTVAFFFITSNGLVQVRQSSDYVPKMIELAGGKYIFENLGDAESKRSTVNMQVEEFYSGAKDADFLIYNSSIDGGISSTAELIDKCGPLADFKAVKEGNVYCTAKDMYQESLSIGYLIEDIHGMLQGETKGMHYLFPVPQKAQGRKAA
ncbi:MAG: ABC transporter substrate-binding protein [Clostridium sp.]|nr:ABC transporter substrate-binding protein [Clostridium sp.]